MSNKEYSTFLQFLNSHAVILSIFKIKNNNNKIKMWKSFLQYLTVYMRQNTYIWETNLYLSPHEVICLLNI